MHILDCVSMPTGFVQFTQNAGLFYRMARPFHHKNSFCSISLCRVK